MISGTGWLGFVPGEMILLFPRLARRSRRKLGFCIDGGRKDGYFSMMMAAGTRGASAWAAKRVQDLRDAGVVLCIRVDDEITARRAALAAIRGGIRAVEVTMTTPGASRIVRHLLRETRGDQDSEHSPVLVGVGTALTADDVNRAADAGASFAFSPVADPEIVRLAHAYEMLAVPGAATPSEIHHAFACCGAAVVKVYPAALVGGIDFVRAIYGPFPDIPLLPTSGIDLSDLTQYLEMPNVVAVGASKQIVSADAVRSENWDHITEAAKQW
eukprot:CAMPEP_0184688730 /NCGR_PEP_ID=MMETSP0312-20130426/30256_1 /TAXON_ID=31354 /ORGANISM="Compsopogon coeruleus, Strain SAG 36.94" /LENGTH=270 /DNA_ID=CAMNT_0027145991 /DNA_START=1064 /DNA_END=1873 /DNA_ORIENTATION=+